MTDVKESEEAVENVIVPVTSPRTTGLVVDEVYTNLYSQLPSGMGMKSLDLLCSGPDCHIRSVVSYTYERKMITLLSCCNEM